MNELKYKYSLFFQKDGLLIFLSQLDLMRLFGRVLQKTKLPVAYSQGFNPHPRYALPYPLPVGCVGRAEILEIYLTRPVDTETLPALFNQYLPPELKVSRAVFGAVAPAYYFRAALVTDWLLPADWPDRTLEKKNKKGRINHYRLGDHVRLEQKSRELFIRPLSDKVLKAEKICALLGLDTEAIDDIFREVEGIVTHLDYAR
ncbi:MAG: TIGR03936 family radical SAM-associated protein [Candidatus Margulisbacteria bacterium]|nr:TIGR03936 family radical SAM-associated protein [Candidatus Margulisiibacteriota bacterium]